MPQLPEAAFPSHGPTAAAAAVPAAPDQERAPGSAPTDARRWSGRTTAFVAAGVLGLSGLGALAAAAATPNGIAAPVDRTGPVGRRPGGFGPGQGGGPAPSGGRLRPGISAQQGQLSVPSEPNSPPLPR